MSPPDLDFVLRVFDLLAAERVRTWVAGGWGQELRGLLPPRAHGGLDLLYPARDWSRADRLRLDWLPAHASAWRRAFVLDGVHVELERADRDPAGWYTRIDGRRVDLPPDVFSASGRLPVASAAALAVLHTARSRRLAA